MKNIYTLLICSECHIEIPHGSIYYQVDKTQLPVCMNCPGFSKGGVTVIEDYEEGN